MARRKAKNRMIPVAREDSAIPALNASRTWAEMCAAIAALECWTPIRVEPDVCLPVEPSRNRWPGADRYERSVTGVRRPARTTGQSFSFIKCRPSRRKAEYVDMKDTAMPRVPARIVGRGTRLAEFEFTVDDLPILADPSRLQVSLCRRSVQNSNPACVRIARKNVCGIRPMPSRGIQHLPEYVLSGASRNSSSRGCG